MLPIGATIAEGTLPTGPRRAGFSTVEQMLCRTALVVDDEATDLEELSRVLTSAGYRVLAAADGNTALKFFQADPKAIDLLVTDIAMNPVNGRDLAMELVRLKPSLRVVFVSGYAGPEVLHY